MIKKLFIGNFGFDLDEGSLGSFIESNGVRVGSLKIIQDRDTGRSRGFAFAELAESQNLNQAIDTLDGKQLNGRALSVNEAKERSQERNRNFGGDNRGHRGASSNRW